MMGILFSTGCLVVFVLPWACVFAWDDVILASKEFCHVALATAVANLLRLVMALTLTRA